MKPFSWRGIFDISGSEEFADRALEVFRFQASECEVYREFINSLNIIPSAISTIDRIPFLPVELFKNRKVYCGKEPPETFFESSGTTGMVASRHYVADIEVYQESYLRTFKHFYGNPEDYVITALLPSYTERENSSLIYMVNDLIKRSGSHLSGFYRERSNELKSAIAEGKREGKKILLIGVTFALLDLAEQGKVDFSGVIIMETGGMKGRREEITREELHKILCNNFNVSEIHSEYGMAELLSQAYSKGNGIFETPPWMKVLIRETYDPLSVSAERGRNGGINIIDLANINSCSFLATGDLGRIHGNGTFEVLGRFDSAGIRGCNLLVV